MFFLSVYLSAEPCEPSCPIPNQNIPASTAAAPGSSVLAAGTSGGGGGGGAGAVPAHQHHAPYDLRRKSPSHHCEAAAGGAGPSTSAATAGGSPASPATPTAPAGGYTSAMLPARKRPRRTCSASYESEYYKIKKSKTSSLKTLQCKQASKNISESPRSSISLVVDYFVTRCNFFFEIFVSF